MQYCHVTFLHLRKDLTTPESAYPAYTITGEGFSTRHVPVPWRTVAEWSGKAVNAHSHIRDLMFRADGHWWSEVGGDPDQGQLEVDSLSYLLEHLINKTRTPNEIWMLTWTGYGGEADTVGLPINVSKPLRSSGREYVLRKGFIEKSSEDPDNLGYEHAPSFWWPNDRSWFVSCDIDGTSTYVGGSTKLIEEILKDHSLEAYGAKLSDLHEGLFVENPVNE